MTNTKISPLKKVSLAFSTVSRQDPLELGEQHLFTFIYGAASGGLSPFEIQLADRHSGEMLQLHLGQDDIRDFFSHLFLPLKNRLALHILPQQLHLHVAINQVETAEDFEIVTAMKEYIGSSCGGGCDCGCH